MEFKKPLLIYDENCPLCLRFKQSIERMPKEEQLYYCPLSSQQVFKQFPELKEEECREIVHLITNEGTILKGPEVVEFLLKLNPAIKNISWMLESESGKKAIEVFYNFAAAARKRLGPDCCSGQS